MSVKIIVESDRETAEKIRADFESGELTELAGFKILDIDVPPDVIRFDSHQLDVEGAWGLRRADEFYFAIMKDPEWDHTTPAYRFGSEWQAIITEAQIFNEKGHCSDWHVVCGPTTIPGFSEIQEGVFESTLVDEPTPKEMHDELIRLGFVPKPELNTFLRGNHNTVFEPDANDS